MRTIQPQESTRFVGTPTSLELLPFVANRPFGTLMTLNGLHGFCKPKWVSRLTKNSVSGASAPSSSGAEWQDVREDERRG